MKHAAFGLILGLVLSSSAAADVVSHPKIYFNVSPDLPVQARLILSAVRLETRALNCTLQIQADLRYSNDAAAQGTLLLPNIKYRVEASGTDTAQILTGEDQLINQGVPGLHYSGGRVLGFTCATDRPSWEIKLRAGKEYFLVYSGEQRPGLQFFDPKTHAEHTKNSAQLTPFGIYSFFPTGSRLLLNDTQGLMVYSYPNLNIEWPISISGPQNSFAERIQQTRFTQDGRYVIASTFGERLQNVTDGSLKVFAVINRKAEGEIRLPPISRRSSHSDEYERRFYSSHFDISPRGDAIILANPYNPNPTSPAGMGLTIYSFPALEKIKEIGRYWASNPVYSKDGKRFGVKNGASVTIYDSTTYEETLRVSFGTEIFAYEFTPTGNNIIADTRNSLQMATLNIPEGPKTLGVSPGGSFTPWYLRLSPYGKYVAVHDFSIIIVPMDGGKPFFIDNFVGSTMTFTPTLAVGPQ